MKKLNLVLKDRSFIFLRFIKAQYPFIYLDFFQERKKEEFFIFQGIRFQLFFGISKVKEIVLFPRPTYKYGKNDWPVDQQINKRFDKAKISWIFYLKIIDNFFQQNLWNMRCFKINFKIDVYLNKKYKHKL